MDESRSSDARHGAAGTPVVSAADSASALSAIDVPPGLTSTEARRRLAALGPNAMPQEKDRPWRGLLATQGLLMSALPKSLIAAVLAGSIGLAFVLDAVKCGVSRSLQMQ